MLLFIEGRPDSPSVLNVDGPAAMSIDSVYNIGGERDKVSSKSQGKLSQGVRTGQVAADVIKLIRKWTINPCRLRLCSSLLP